MSPLPPPAAVSAPWTSDVRDAVVESGELRATVRVLSPAGASYVPYDPVTDTGGPAAPSVLISDRKARIQAQGSPSADGVNDDGYDSVQRRHLIELVDVPGDPELREGMIVHCTAMEDGGDPFLVGKRFIIEDAAGSSSHALRLIRCWLVS